MNARHLATALLLCTPLVACSNSQPPAAPASSSTSAPAAPSTQPTSSLGKLVDKEIQEARKKLATENISVNGGVRVSHGDHGGINVFSDDENDKRPKAEISPKGDLLIDGKAVAINAEQRAMLLEYRAHVISVAESGMEIGVQGADLAAKAMGEAFKGIFSGKSEQDIEKSVEAEAGKIKLAATKLCGKLPAMMSSQQKLAAALPEFKPYATMTQEDIDECRDESHKDYDANRAEQVREEVRETIRDTVRTESQHAAKDEPSQDESNTTR